VNQASYERVHAEEWNAFEAALAARPAPVDLPQRYRRLCRDLALAEDRGFSTSLVDRLNRLALAGHQRLYGARRRPVGVVAFFAARFPEALRREWKLFAAASLLFYGVGMAVFAAHFFEPDLIYRLMPPETVATFEEMYDPEAEHYGAPRDTVGDFSAFAYYTSNNIGVALRTFAWGIFAGVGSLFVLTLNALSIGAIAAHLSLSGHAEPFFSFVIGHGSFELTAIVLAGAAGMKLGWSLVAPGPHLRRDAIRLAARDCVPLLYGAVAMLLVAAVIEAFWSSADAVPASVKFAVGSALWVCVGLWLGFGGRARARRAG